MRQPARLPVAAVPITLALSSPASTGSSSDSESGASTVSSSTPRLTRSLITRLAMTSTSFLTSSSLGADVSAEERGRGSKRLLDAGLFKRFGRPDYALALHADALLAAGQVGFAEGPYNASIDSVDITVRGAGGHGAYPHTTRDPVVIASRLVVALQTIVSREVDPVEPAVVTVGTIHGGTKRNVIPEEVKLELLKAEAR